MIIIAGSILARPETFDELRGICVEHTRRSRTEQGCEHHSVHIDAENGLRLVFLERWSGRAAVLAHFAEPNARAFIARHHVNRLFDLLGSRVFCFHFNVHRRFKKLI